MTVFLQSEDDVLPFQIPNVLSADELTHIRNALAEAEFVDAKATAGWYAKQVKHNQQLKQGAGQPLKATVSSALERHPLFQVAVRPKQIHNLRFSRYNAGMSYGTHADNAMMGRYRSDISFTLFLSEPGDYTGGELVIEGAMMNNPINYVLAAPWFIPHRPYIG